MKNNTNKSKTRYKMTTRRKKDFIAGYLFVGIFVIGFLSFTLMPFVYSFYLSFTEYDVLNPPKWIGVENYIRMFIKDDLFWHSFKVTCKFALAQVPLRLIVSLIVALLMVKTTKMTGIYRLAFYIPSLIGGSVAVALTWKQLWDVNGAINQMLTNIGLPTVNWLNNTKTALYILVLLGVWQFGSQMLIFLAALKDVPASLMEAATIDGAKSFKRFFYVTLPILTPSIFFNLVNGIIGSMQAFSSAYLISSGGPLNSTLYYGLYQYRQAFQYRKMGYASAMAWFLMVVVVALTALIFRSSSSWVYYQDET